ncbi:hypothetical protein [Actinoplanes sp. NPDC051494]|uniref:hypothetical protein n=1 Tax=Actinoplanes sp. NPDC051494 TaxID=3363907 RepID=UPI00378890C7
MAVCEQGTEALPGALTAEAVAGFLEHVRRSARDTDHARLVAQIYAEAAVSPQLAVVVRQQLAAKRAAVAELVPERRQDAAQIAEVFVALCASYSQQLAIRGDLEPAPFVAALMAIIEKQRVIRRFVAGVGGMP